MQRLLKTKWMSIVLQYHVYKIKLTIFFNHDYFNLFHVSCVFDRYSKFDETRILDTI